MLFTDKLKQLNMPLPPVSGPFGAYVPAKRVGNLIRRRQYPAPRRLRRDRDRLRGEVNARTASNPRGSELKSLAKYRVNATGQRARHDAAPFRGNERWRSAFWSWYSLRMV